MADKHWKQHERETARLLGGRRYPANTGGRVDVESSPRASSRSASTSSGSELEALALEADQIGRACGKAGVVCVKRRAGAGCPTPRLVCMTAEVWAGLHAGATVE